MNRNAIRAVSPGTSRQLKGKIKQQWVRLTDAEIDELGDDAEQLAGKLQEHYGWERSEARTQVKEFYRRERQLH